MRIKLIFVLAAVLLFAAGAVPAYAEALVIPHAFYGNVTINGNPAPAGTPIEARGTGVVKVSNFNPLTITQTGKYGSANPLEARLLVQGNIEEGTIISFYVSGVAADQTAEWHSGLLTELNLSCTITGGGGGGGGGGGAALSPTPTATATATTTPGVAVPAATPSIPPPVTMVATTPPQTTADATGTPSSTAPVIPVPTSETAGIRPSASSVPAVTSPPDTTVPGEEPAVANWGLIAGIIVGVALISGISANFIIRRHSR